MGYICISVLNTTYKNIIACLLLSIFLLKGIVTIAAVCFSSHNVSSQIAADAETDDSEKETEQKLLEKEYLSEFDHVSLPDQLSFCDSDKITSYYRADILIPYLAILTPPPKTA